MEDKMKLFLKDKADTALSKVWKEVSRKESNVLAIPDLFRKAVWEKYDNPFGGDMNRFIEQQLSRNKPTRAFEDDSDDGKTDPERFIIQ
jgi:hypothetical protein